MCVDRQEVELDERAGPADAREPVVGVGARTPQDLHAVDLCRFELVLVGHQDRAEVGLELVNGHARKDLLSPGT